MLEVSEIARLLKDRRLDLVSEATGLSPQTISRIRDGLTIDPSVSTVKALSDYLTKTAVIRGG